MSDDKKEEIQKFHKFLIASFEKAIEYDHYGGNEMGRAVINTVVVAIQCWRKNKPFKGPTNDGKTYAHPSTKNHHEIIIDQPILQAMMMIHQVMDILCQTDESSHTKDDRSATVINPKQQSIRSEQRILNSDCSSYRRIDRTNKSRTNPRKIYFRPCYS